MAQQRTIDEGYCTQVAHGSAPMPDVRVYSPAQHSYNISGTISSYGSGGFQSSSYTGYVTPSAGASFTTGFAQGAALGASIRARRAQDKIMKGCMLKLGWTDKPPTQEHNAQAPINTTNTSDGQQDRNDDQEYVEFSCSSHRKLAGHIDHLMRNGASKKEALELVLNTSRNLKIGYQSATYLLWATNARYLAPEMPTEDFVDFITDYCSQGWPDVKL